MLNTDIIDAIQHAGILKADECGAAIP